MTGQKDRYSTTEKLWDLDDKTLSTPAHDELVLMLLNREKIFSIFGDPCPEDKVTILSEVPIKTSNGFIVGYWDVVVIYTDTTDDTHTEYFIEVKPTISSFGATLRQIKTYMEYFYPQYFPLLYVWDEIRTYLNIPNHIKNERAGRVYLFTPDLRFKDAFESQGIKVISP